MTRPIDADALIKELEKAYEYYMAEIKDANEHPENYTSKFLPATAGAIDGLVDAEIVIADAPTIEPDGDLISRKEVLETIIIAGECEPGLGYTHLHDVIEALPSATSQSLTKPNKSCEDDLISRADAIALVIKAIHGTDNKEIKEYLFDGLRKQMWSLPSAESTGAMDEAIQKYIKDGYMQPIGEDLISRQDAIEVLTETIAPPSVILDTLVMRIDALPSAEAVQGKWKTAYLDHEAMGERPSVIYCSRCNHCFAYKTNFCPNCGADMRGGDSK